jgi:hypothetical protein
MKDLAAPYASLSPASGRYPQLGAGPCSEA